MNEKEAWQNSPEQARVGIIMGSDSDLEIMKKAADVLVELEVNHEINIISAHRTTTLVSEYARGALGRGLEVIIAGAGGAAHLPGLTAAETDLQVIGVPIEHAYHSPQNAALFSIVDMPFGIPVLTVGTNRADNAALGAVQLLARQDPSLQDRYHKFKENMYDDVVAKNKLLQRIGASAYLEAFKNGTLNDLLGK